MPDLAATPGNLQPDGVARDESSGRNSFVRLPTWRPLVMRCQIRRRVQSQTGDDCVSVTVVRVNGNPLAPAALAIFSKFGGANW